MSCNSGCVRATYSNNVKVMDPSGCWEYDQLIGAKVKVKSMPVSNFFSTFDSNRLYTISSLFFRISIDGKAITVVKLEGLEDKFFTLKDLMVVEVCYKIKYRATCGEFLCNQSVIGYEVDKTATSTPTPEAGTVAVIGDKGNIVTGKIIKVSGSQVTVDDSTGLIDITVNGDVIF